jgi:NADH-quinone oxidoreductase subunit A
LNSVKQSDAKNRFEICRLRETCRADSANARFLDTPQVACYKPTAFPLVGARSCAARASSFKPMLSAYIPIAIFVVVATGFALFTLVFSSLLHPEKYNKVKLEPYECGIEPTTDARDRYSIRYYLVAMLFVIFDVETVFMFPWAVIFDRLMLFGLIEMMVFIFILVVGYYYAWQKGALEWA